MQESLLYRLAYRGHGGLCPGESGAVAGYTHHVRQSSDGLPEQTVQAFAQTPDGFLPIGTSGGLRFDGLHLAVFDCHNMPALRENSVFCLMVSRDGGLWIGTESGGRPDTHTPESAAVEEVFYAQNVKTALKLSHARGVVLLTMAEAGLAVGEYSPLEIKTSVVGYGRAEKQQVKLMVHSLLALETKIDSEDACDAIAVAICHATRTSTDLRMRAAL